METVKRVLSKVLRRPKHLEHGEGEHDATEQLHGMATRLHVLEWEAYGRPQGRRRRGD